MVSEINAEREARIREAIKRFKAYIDAGKSEEVRIALEAKSISSSTMRSWKKEPKKILTSYRAVEFVEAIGTLPDLDRVKRNQAYEFALKELGISRDSQHDLETFRGLYRAFHNFPGIEINNFIIEVEHSPFAALFVFKYNNRDGHRGKCDGLIVARHGRLVCAGFSPTTMFQAAFRWVGRPQKELIRGMAFIEDLDSQQVCFSNIVLAHDPNPAMSHEAARIVEGTGRSL